MNINGMRKHAEYARRHQDAPWYHRGGNLRICLTEEEAERTAAMMLELAGFDYPSRWLSETELMSIEPDLAPDVVRRAQVAFFPSECWIDGAPLIARLLADARSNGATVRVSPKVVGFETGRGSITAARFEGGERVEADVFALCAGPAAGALAAKAGCHVPLANEPGFQVYTAPTAVALGRVIHSPALNLRPDGAGRICLHDFAADETLLPREGASREELETNAGAWRVDPAAVETLLARLKEFYPGTEGVPAEAARVGMRPIPRDRKPIIGFLEPWPNLYAAVMHSGATQALWVGELATREIIDGPVGDLAFFRPARFAAVAEQV
jgi:glycine/D-amino acid oxidase-like deaminating enzyme